MNIKLLMIIFGVFSFYCHLVSCFNTNKNLENRVKLIRSLNYASQMNKLTNVFVEFIEQPIDTYITKTAAVIKCSVKNAVNVYIECNNKILDVFINDSNKNANGEVKNVTTSIKRKEFIEFKQAVGKSKQFVCVCVALSENNEKVLSKKAIIRNSYIETEFQSDPMDESTYEGDTVELRCDPPRGEPLPSVYWLKNGELIDTSADSSRYKISNDNSLLILVVDKKDSGNYVCVANNLMDKRLSKPAKLTVLDGEDRYIWSDWSEWSLCSVQCGEGVIKRKRTCKNISSGQNVSNAFCPSGESTEEEPCLVSLCLVDAQWGDWQQWTMCTSECKQFRKRNCELPSGEITNEKDCEMGERLQIRNCTTSKLCRDKFNNQQIPLYSKIPGIELNNEETTAKISKNSLIDQASNLSPKYIFDKNVLSLLIGLTTVFIIVVIAVIFIALYFSKRKSSRKPDLNLYYTCEQPFNPSPDTPSRMNYNNHNNKHNKPIGYFKASLNDVVHHDNKGHLYNSLIERQLLLNNIPPSQQQQQKNVFVYDYQQNEYEQASSMLHLDRSLNNAIMKHSLNSLSNMHQSETTHKDSPTNFTTTTTVDSGTTTSSSSYYATPNNEIIRSYKNSPFRTPPSNSAFKSSNSKTNQKNHPVRFDVDLIKNTRVRRKNPKFPNSVLVSAHSSPSLVAPVDSGKDIVNDSYIHMQSCVGSPFKSTPNLFNKMLNNISPSDICVETVGSNGAKLSLDCGITLLVPEDAIPADKVELMYLAICRQESSMIPKLSDKASSLSTVIVIGPPTLVLHKPVMLIIDHCIENANEDWNISLFSSPNDGNLAPKWTEELNDSRTENENMFLNVTDKHFILMTDSLCRYAFTGESKHSKHIASKFMRLVAYCSSCITSDNFNLRIYCVDDLFFVLQEILKDEEQIGGIIMDTSDPFPVAYQNAGDAICISVDEFSEGWNCKYNVNKQEIPVNHIWNGRNHLLHCAFTIERQNSISEQFKCKIKAFQTSVSNRHSIIMDINYGIENNITLNENSPLCSWLNLFKESQPYKFSKTYAQMDRNLKKQICHLLDDTATTEKSWKILAEKLSISKNLKYFGLKRSPTDILLLYFEAINYLRSAKTYNITRQSSQSNENNIHTNQHLANEIFSKYFLNYFNENSDLVSNSRIIYANS